MNKHKLKRFHSFNVNKNLIILVSIFFAAIVSYSVIEYALYKKHDNYNLFFYVLNESSKNPEVRLEVVLNDGSLFAGNFKEICSIPRDYFRFSTSLGYKKLIIRCNGSVKYENSFWLLGVRHIIVQIYDCCDVKVTFFYFEPISL
jgi:hypothetical protein